MRLKRLFVSALLLSFALGTVDSLRARADAKATSAEQFLKLDRAQLQATVDGLHTSDNGSAKTEVLGIQQLPWKWDSRFARQSGVLQATFAFSVEDLRRVRVPTSEAMGAYALNIGNRYRYSVNGAPWINVHWDQATSNYRTRPQWLLIDKTDLQTNNTLVLELKVNPANYAGLTALEIGTVAAIAQHYQQEVDVRRLNAVAIGTVSLLVALLALGIWYAFRDNAYAYVALFEASASARYFSLLVDYPLIPTWLWNWLITACYALSLGGILAWSMALSNDRSRSLRLLVTGFLWLTPVFLFVGHLLGEARFYTITLALMNGLALVFTVRTIYQWWLQRSFELMLLVLSASVFLITGVYDFVWRIQVRSARRLKDAFST